jgi:hypothetical protein
VPRLVSDEPLAAALGTREAGEGGETGAAGSGAGRPQKQALVAFPDSKVTAVHKAPDDLMSMRKIDVAKIEAARRG